MMSVLSLGLSLNERSNAINAAWLHTRFRSVFFFFFLYTSNLSLLKTRHRQVDYFSASSGVSSVLPKTI